MLFDVGMNQNLKFKRYIYIRSNLRMDGQTDIRRKRDDFLGLSHKDPLSFAQTIIDIPPTNDRQFSGRAGSSHRVFGGKTRIKRTRAKTIRTVESVESMHLKFTIPSSSNIHYIATPLRVSQSWLCHNFTAAVKPRELNEKPSSPSPSSLESRAQSSSAELNQREAIKFSYCPMQPTATATHGTPSTRGQRNAKSRSFGPWEKFIPSERK